MRKSYVFIILSVIFGFFLGRYSDSLSDDTSKEIKSSKMYYYLHYDGCFDIKKLKSFGESIVIEEITVANIFSRTDGPIKGLFKIQVPHSSNSTFRDKSAHYFHDCTPNTQIELVNLNDALSFIVEENKEIDTGKLIVIHQKRGENAFVHYSSK